MKTNFSRFVVIGFVSLQFYSTHASDYQSPRTLSLGGSGHASALQIDPIAMNMSQAAFLPAYQVSAAFQKYKGNDDSQEPRGRVSTFGILDGNETTTPMGVFYSRRAEGAILALGIAHKINENFSVGLSGKTTLKSSRNRINRDFSTSATYRLSSQFQFAFITDNVIANKDRAAPWNQYREYTVGTRYSPMNGVIFYADPHYTPSIEKNWGWEAGAEFATFADLFLRVGRSVRSYQSHLSRYGSSLGYGLGYVGPRIALDFAISHAEANAKTRSLVASATIMF